MGNVIHPTQEVGRRFNCSSLRAQRLHKNRGMESSEAQRTTTAKSRVGSSKQRKRAAQLAQAAAPGVNSMVEAPRE